MEAVRTASRWLVAVVAAWVLVAVALLVVHTFTGRLISGAEFPLALVLLAVLSLVIERVLRKRSP